MAIYTSKFTQQEIDDGIDNANRAVQPEALDGLIDGKVDKVSGKGLSTNDYTTDEKNKLSGIASGAEVNQNAFSNVGVKVGNTTTKIAADAKTDTVTLIQGSNVTLTADTTNDTITIAAKDTKYTAATAAPGKVASSSAQGSSTNYARQDHTHGIDVATGDSNGQVKIAGTNVSVKGLGSAAYTASSAYAVSHQLESDANLNDIKTAGFYNAGGGNTITNKPSGVEHFGMEVIHHASGNYYVQIVYNDYNSWRRRCVNGTWGSWVQDELTDTTYSAATTTAAGLMSAADKNKLAGIAAGAEVNVQSDWNATSGDAFIKNKPTIPVAVAVKGNAETSYRTGNVNITPANIGLGNVGNFKAVSTAASQGLSDTEKANARANIGAGTSSFSGSYNDLSNKPTIPAAAANGTYTVKTLVGSTTTNVSNFTANQSSADDVTFVQGSNVTITPDATNRKITIAATDTTYSSKAAASGGTDVSLVTTGEKYNWNSLRVPKISVADYTTAGANYTIFASVSSTSTSRYKDCTVLVSGAGYYYGGNYTGTWLVEMRSSNGGVPRMRVTCLAEPNTSSTITFGYYTDSTAAKTYFGVKSTSRRGEFNVTTLVNNSGLFTIAAESPVTAEPTGWTAASMDVLVNETQIDALTRHTRLTDFNLNDLKKAVADANLEKYGLKVGDEKTINGHTYVVAGLNPMKGTNTHRVTTNHVGLVVIPHVELRWNVSGKTNEGAYGRGAGYINSDLHYYIKNTLLPLVKTDLGDANLLGHGKLLSNAVTNGKSSGWTFEEGCKICALSEVQVYGTTVWSSSSYDTGEACRQLEVFQKYSHTEIFKDESIFLRDVASASTVSFAVSDGRASDSDADGYNYVAALILFH